jgi:hypothetical protein
MNKRRLLLGLVPTILFSLILATGVLAAASAATSTFRRPVINQSDPEPVVVECDGTMISLDGYVSGVSHATTDGTGRIHVSVLSNFKDVYGTGPGGEMYRGSGTMSENFVLQSIDGNNQSVKSKIIERFKLSGPGRGKPYAIKMTMFMSLNANGDTTVDFDKSSLDCTRWP